MTVTFLPTTHIVPVDGLVMGGAYTSIAAALTRDRAQKAESAEKNIMRKGGGGGGWKGRESK